MKKKRTFLLSVALVTFLATSLTALAGPPWIVPACGICGKCVEHGTNLSYGNSSHTVTYTENGQLKSEICNISYSEDDVCMECPNGHGIIWRGSHFKESHSSKYCNSLDYWK